MEEERQEPQVTLPRNHFIAIVVGVCVLAAAIGSGVALLAQTGPAGPAGKQGPRGPAGPAGPEGAEGASAEAEVGALEDEVAELREAVEEGGGNADLEERVEELEGAVAEQGELTSELCAEIELIC
ncbi:MAG TPA: hypothetical protein VFI17_07675 [Solirubrobacterales bacterium]|nr:hypothetical protein [Solirubrobacterales bacterium]